MITPLSAAVFALSNLGAVAIAAALTEWFVPRGSLARRASVLFLSCAAVVCAVPALLAMAGWMHGPGVAIVVVAAVVALQLARPHLLRDAATRWLTDISGAIAAPRHPWDVALMAVGVGLIGLYVAKAALLATTFVTDDLIYHAPAAAHWVQAQRLTLAPQNYHAFYPLLPELAATWFMLPFHADGFASLTSVLWLRIAAVSLAVLAMRLHGTRAAGWLAIVLLLATPAVLRATETFDSADVAAAALALAAVSLVVPAAGASPRAAEVALAGLALGLALGCRVVVAPLVPVLCVFVWTSSRTAGSGTAARRVLLFALAVAVAGGPWYVRNWLLTGNPVFPAAFGPFAGPFDAATQDHTRLASRLFDSASDWPLRWALLRSALNWPLPLALLSGAGYVVGLASMLRGNDRGAFAVIWWSGVCLAVGTVFAPFSGTTNSPDAAVAFSHRYFLAPFAIGLALCAGMAARAAWAPRVAVAVTLLWALAAAHIPPPAWIAVGTIALGVLLVRRVSDRNRRRLLVAFAVCVPLLLLATAPSKQGRTDNEILARPEWGSGTGDVLRQLESLPPGLRLARFGPNTYPYYALFGRRMQIEPVAVTWTGRITGPLEDLNRAKRGWWAPAPDSAFGDDVFLSGMRDGRVDLVFVTRFAGSDWPPQRAALQASATARELHADALISLWRLDRTVQDTAR